jgi:hypothetical protein
MSSMKSFAPRARQSGAALVVGLILLVAITLMAISSMRGSTLDLIMAGNEQFRSRAFFAAETGIEAAYRNGAVFNTSTDYTLPSPVSVGSGSDRYTFTITRPNDGRVEPPPPRNSVGTFGAVYFAINSTGTSERNAESRNVQEVFQVVRAPEDSMYNEDVCAGTSDLEGSLSSC